MSTSPDSSTASSVSSSASSSPTLKPTSSRLSPPAAALPRSSRFSSIPAISPIPEDEPLQTLNDDVSSRLQDDREAFEASNDLKSRLTELLNSEAVRSDSKMRAWVQMRLMDAELELKRQRRRKRSLPSREVEAVTEVS